MTASTLIAAVGGCGCGPVRAAWETGLALGCFVMGAGLALFSIVAAFRNPSWRR